MTVREQDRQSLPNVVTSSLSRLVPIDKKSLKLLPKPGDASVSRGQTVAAIVNRDLSISTFLRNEQDCHEHRISALLCSIGLPASLEFISANYASAVHTTHEAIEW